MSDGTGLQAPADPSPWRRTGLVKRMLIMLLLVALVLGGVFAFIAFKSQMMKEFMTAKGIPTQTVATAVAAYEDWLPKLRAVGSLRAVEGTDLSSEVAGMVSQIHFRQGDEVRAGTPIVQLRNQDDWAKLQSLRAAANIARITYERDKAQVRARAISQQVLDNDRAALDQATANLEQQQALLDKKTVRAPFSGRLGPRLVDLGQYLEAGTPMVTLQALDPLYVDFLLPQQALGSVAIGQKLTVRIDAFPGRGFGGEVTVINPKVDLNTRNVQFRGVLKNPERRLLPGMFANIEVDLGEPRKYITVPRTAISFNPYGATVYRVEPAGTDAKGQARLVAKQSFVSTGETRGDQVAIIEGLKAGDTVVVAGQMKLRNDMPVAVDNSLKPSDDPAPQPADE